MNLIFRMVLAMSLSGALLILLLFFGRVVLKNRLSRQWQYYIWLIVLIRLWIPFGPEESLMGRVEQATQGMMAQMTQEARPAGQNGGQGSEGEGVQNSEGEGVQNSGQSSGLDEQQNTAHSASRSAAQRPPQFAAEKPEESVTENGASLSEGMALAGKYLWVIWLTVALGMLIRKISMYQSYIKYVRAGAEPVSDVALLDRLSVTAQEMGIGRAIELCVNPHVASPMLVGYFHPCIVLPCADVQERKFCYMAMHELTHYKRRDIFYKWLVQLTVCLHWFNPFVYWMRREMERACEFSCDEAVVVKMGYGHAADYGETLLDVMAAAGTYSEPLAAVTMSANKELLRERLGAIMSCKKKTKQLGMITAGLTVCIALAAFFLGVYPAAAAETKNAETEALSVSDKTRGTDYDGTTLAPETSGDAGEENVEKEIPVQEKLAGTSEEAAADQKLNFQSVLYDKLDMDEEWDEVEKVLEEEQIAQYQAVGVTKNGKNYYYQGQLVNIFLDIHRPDRSFYTLSMNPAGTVNVKIIRAQDGQITGAAYLTEAEIEELFGDMEEDVNAEADEEAETFPKEMTVAMPVCKLREGAGEMFQVVGLIGEGETVIVLAKEEGEDGQMWYLLDRESLSEPPDDSVKECYIRADLLK